MHSHCADYTVTEKTSTYAKMWSLDGSLARACCMSTAGKIRDYFLIIGYLYGGINLNSASALQIFIHTGLIQPTFNTLTTSPMGTPLGTCLASATHEFPLVGSVYLLVLSYTNNHHTLMCNVTASAAKSAMQQLIWDLGSVFLFLKTNCQHLQLTSTFEYALGCATVEIKNLSQPSGDALNKAFLLELSAIAQQRIYQLKHFLSARGSELVISLGIHHKKNHLKPKFSPTLRHTTLRQPSSNKLLILTNSCISENLFKNNCSAIIKCNSFFHQLYLNRKDTTPRILTLFSKSFPAIGAMRQVLHHSRAVGSLLRRLRLNQALLISGGGLALMRRLSESKRVGSMLRGRSPAHANYFSAACTRANHHLTLTRVHDWVVTRKSGVNEPLENSPRHMWPELMMEHFNYMRDGILPFFHDFVGGLDFRVFMSNPFDGYLMLGINDWIAECKRVSCPSESAMILKRRYYRHLTNHDSCICAAPHFCRVNSFSFQHMKYLHNQCFVSHPNPQITSILPRELDDSLRLGVFKKSVSLGRSSPRSKNILFVCSLYSPATFLPAIAPRLALSKSVEGQKINKVRPLAVGRPLLTTSGILSLVSGWIFFSSLIDAKTHLERPSCSRSPSKKIKIKLPSL
ncbi:hypothetical protein VP01_1761g3 [Puccinia sorghi]|uniref:Uncharacterized protein n=1 Tax=Puccinia sorghi TaxID=27349 RepID=A0A0L6VFH2_9BASI|nr:hypothetical protein VP01_1761g3 [Puccinia sorghi]